MSIRNFPLIPKIILRKSADQAKGEKSFPELATTFCAGSDVLLRGATLNRNLGKILIRGESGT